MVTHGYNYYHWCSLVNNRAFAVYGHHGHLINLSPSKSDGWVLAMRTRSSIMKLAPFILSGAHPHHSRDHMQ